MLSLVLNPGNTPLDSELASLEHGLTDIKKSSSSASIFFFMFEY